MREWWEQAEGVACNGTKLRTTRLLSCKDGRHALIN